MTTLNIAKTIFSKVVFAGAVMGMMVALTACGGKDGGSRTAVGPGGRAGERIIGPGCSTCTSHTNILASAVTNYAPMNMQMELDFYTDGGAPTANGYYGSGGVSANGRLHAYGGSYGYGCHLYPGVYELRPIGAGQWDEFGGMVRNVAIEGLGPNGSRIIMKINKGGFFQEHPNVVSCSGQVYSQSMWAETVIESVDGFQCYMALDFTFIDGQGAQCNYAY